MENLCSQGYTQQVKYLAVKNPGLLRAGIWEEEGSHEGSLFTSVYATIEEGGSRSFLKPKDRPKTPLFIAASFDCGYMWQEAESMMALVLLSALV